jgi:hypothetical protein
VEAVGCIILALITMFLGEAISGRRRLRLPGAGALVFICALFLGAGGVSLVFGPDTRFAIPLVALAVADIGLAYYYLVVVLFERR